MATMSSLVFDRPPLLAFQLTAELHGVDTQDMIAEAVVNMLGPVLATRAHD